MRNKPSVKSIRGKNQESVNLSSPEKAIWSAVMEVAILDAAGKVKALPYTTMEKDKVRQNLQDEAIEWINNDSDNPYTFHWVCNLLDLDPDAVREALQEREYRDGIRACMNFSRG